MKCISYTVVLRIRANLFVTVTGTPTGVIVMRTGCYTVQLSWAPPISNAPPVAGYEVFFELSGSNTTQSGGTATSTAITVVLPLLNVTYELFVVAYSDAANALPSAHSNIVTIDMSEYYSVNIK